MGTIDIMYLVIVGITFIFGLLFAIKMFIKIRNTIRNSSIEEFKKRQQNNRNKIKYGRHN